MASDLNLDCNLEATVPDKPPFIQEVYDSPATMNGNGAELCPCLVPHPVSIPASWSYTEVPP